MCKSVVWLVLGNRLQTPKSNDVLTYSRKKKPSQTRNEHVLTESHRKKLMRTFHCQLNVTKKLEKNVEYFAFEHVKKHRFPMLRRFSCFSSFLPSRSPLFFLASALSCHLSCLPSVVLFVLCSYALLLSCCS